MDYETLLKEYHAKIGEIFLAKGQTPFRICKQIWKVHAEMTGKLASLPTTYAPDRFQRGQADAKSLQSSEVAEVSSATTSGR